MIDFKVGDIVTYDIVQNSSNTFIVDAIVDEIVYLTHPLNDECVLKTFHENVNEVAPVLKDDTERCLGFAKSNIEYLDFNSKGDLEAMCMFFVHKRRLTSKQKSALSNMCGIIASIEFNNDIQNAMNFIVKNEGVLDEFNRMWYNNFQGLFKGSQAITSKKQRASIFNIAGFALAQAQSPMATK